MEGVEYLEKNCGFTPEEIADALPGYHVQTGIRKDIAARKKLGAQGALGEERHG